MEHIDPTNVAALNERIHAWSEPGDGIQPVRIRRIIIADDAIDALVDELRTIAAGKRVLLVADHTPMQRGPDDVKALIEDRLGHICKLTARRLPADSNARFHAKLEIAQQLANELVEANGGFAAIISVGSGSITDTAKCARHLHANQTGNQIPFVCFPTAASVTAYTSALAAMTVAGAKRTLPATAPEVVVCDLRTLADAPGAMTQAGFGDVLARSVSYGDWYLANQLGMDDGFSLVPGKLLECAEQEMLAQAECIGTGNPEAVRACLEALLLSGMAMSIARQTAPLSGWEHAISHFLDLTAASTGRELALHGGQVGIATLVSARAYESAWNELDLDRLVVDRDDAFYREPLEQTFDGCAESRELAAELWNDFATKLTCWRSAIQQRRRFIERKRAGEFDEFINRAVRTADKIDTALRQAGAPRRWCDLDNPVFDDCAVTAVRRAHLVRSRFTLGDLLTEADWLGMEQVIDLLRGMITAEET